MREAAIKKEEDKIRKGYDLLIEIFTQKHFNWMILDLALIIHFCANKTHIKKLTHLGPHTIVILVIICI